MRCHMSRVFSCPPACLAPSTSSGNSYDSALLPIILSLTLSPNFILFSYLPLRFLIKPIRVANPHSVQKGYSM